jgi:hypothetical protein
MPLPLNALAKKASSHTIFIGFIWPLNCRLNLFSRFVRSSPSRYSDPFARLQVFIMAKKWAIWSRRIAGKSSQVRAVL